MAAAALEKKLLKVKLLAQQRYTSFFLLFSKMLFIISVVMYLAIIILGHQSANCFEATHVIQVSVLYATVQVRDFLKYTKKFRENTRIASKMI